MSDINLELTSTEQFNIPVSLELLYPIKHSSVYIGKRVKQSSYFTVEKSSLAIITTPNPEGKGVRQLLFPFSKGGN